jgi:hypothetical protein
MMTCEEKVSLLIDKNNELVRNQWRLLDALRAFEFIKVTADTLDDHVKMRNLFTELDPMDLTRGKR